jgi:hypothetical membrane protein
MQIDSGWPLRRSAAWLAVAGPALFTLAWIALGILQPPTHNMYGIMGGISGAISNPISGLGVGPHAQLFNAAFVICGILTLMGTVGVFRVLGQPRRVAYWCSLVLLALSPIGLAMAGIYDLATSIALHTAAAGLLFLAPVAGFAVAGSYLRGIPQWRRFGTALLIASPLSLVLAVLYVVSFNQAAVAAGEGIAGLTERILILEIQAWYVAMGWRALRERSS